MVREQYTADKYKVYQLSHIREMWDTFNHSCRVYGIATHSTIDEDIFWSGVFFLNILDIFAYNTYVLYQIRPTFADKDGSSHARFKFLCAFGEELIKPNTCI